MKTKLILIVPIYGDISSLELFDQWTNYLEDFSGLIKAIAVFDSTGTPKSNENLKHINDMQLKNLEVIQGNFGSPGLARNAALEVAKAEWISFCDADDFPNLDQLLRLVEDSQTSNCETIIGSFELKNLGTASTSLNILDNYGSARNYYLISKNPGIWRFVFKQETLRGIRFSSLMMGEDQVFLMEYFSRVRNIKFSDSIVYTYFQGVKGQLTGNLESKREIIKCLTESKKILNQKRIHDYYLLGLLINMYLRQSLTGIKVGIGVDKIISFKHLFASFRFALILGSRALRKRK